MDILKLLKEKKSLSDIDIAELLKITVDKASILRRKLVDMGLVVTDNPRNHPRTRQLVNYYKLKEG